MVMMPSSAPGCALARAPGPRLAAGPGSILGCGNVSASGGPAGCRAYAPPAPPVRPCAPRTWLTRGAGRVGDWGAAAVPRGHAGAFARARAACLRARAGGRVRRCADSPTWLPWAARDYLSCRHASVHTFICRSICALTSPFPLSAHLATSPTLDLLSLPSSLPSCRPVSLPFCLTHPLPPSLRPSLHPALMCVCVRAGGRACARV